MTQFAHPLTWVKVKKEHRYVLQDAQGTELASMTFGKWNYAKATVTTKDASYQIEPRNWWNASMVITRNDGKEIGTFKYQWNMKGVLKLEDKTYTWAWDNWWGTKWKWTDMHKRDVMRLYMEGFWQQKGKMETVGNAGDYELLLMIIGWYAMYQSMMSSSGATGTMAAIS